MKSLDMRDVSIIDAFPVVGKPKTVLTVGCGAGRLEHHLMRMLGYDVLATDIKNMMSDEKIPFKEMDILDSQLIQKDIVICSEVLEHIKEWKRAFWNLRDMASMRLIVTVPYENSFDDPGHVNYWNDKGIQEFVKIGRPYSVSISKIRTKPKDAYLNQWAFLIVLDKRQNI